MKHPRRAITSSTHGKKAEVSKHTKWKDGRMRKAKPGRKQRVKSDNKTSRGLGSRAKRKKVKSPGGRKRVLHSSAERKSVRKRSSARRGAVQAPKTERRPDIHPLDRAIAELRAELAKNPDDATLLGRLAALHYRRGDLEGAEQQYRQALKLTPNRPTLYNNLGNVLCDMGRMRDGIAAYETAIALEKAADPSHEPSPEALVNLEMAKIENKLIHERIEYLEKAAQLDVSSAEAANALGCAYLLRGLRVKACETFRKAQKMDPRNTHAALNIAFCHTLNLDGSLNMTEALAEVATSILRFPGEAWLYIHQAELYENAGLLEDAEARYLRALQADGFCLQAYDLLGRLREATGNVCAKDSVARHVETALKRLGDDSYAKAFASVARARFTRSAQSDLEQIDTWLRDAAGGSTANAPRAAVLRAHLMETEGRRAEAALVLEQASQKFPSDFKLWFERGTLALRGGEIDNAVAAFDRASLCAPQHAPAYHSLRFAFEGYRRYRAERVRFESATRSNPRDAMAHHHMALAALSILKNEEALFHFTRALELDARLSDAACGRGRSLQRMGHYEEAEIAYAKALEIDPENAEAQRSLVALRARRLTASAIVPTTE